MSLFRRMPIQVLLDRAGGEELHRHMGLFALVLLGVGGTIGSGIFVLTGTAAAQYAGPAIALSFVIAGVACLFAGLCYAELASMIPVAGSAYTYAFAAMGEFVAWIIGWSLVLEYLFATSTVAVGWSGYFAQFLTYLSQNYAIHIALPHALTSPPIVSTGNGQFALGGGIINLPAALAILAIAAILTLGVKRSTLFNVLVVLLKVGVILAVIGVGFFHVNPANWHPFIPPNNGTVGDFGWSGVIRGAGVVFFAYIGFDMVSSSAQEVKNPARNVPLGLMLTLAVVSVLYVAMALVQTGLAHYTELNVAFPVLVAVQHGGAFMSQWLQLPVLLGVVIGLFAAMFIGVYGQSRIFYAMGKDGLLPPAFSRLNKVKVPAFSIWLTAFFAALVAAVVPVQLLGELSSIGTLLAFAIVCIGVLVLRITHPDTPRGFRMPFWFLLVSVVLGVASCVGMMALLPPATWIRLAVWLALGFVVYFAYSVRKSVLAPKTVAEQG
ncbi:MAG TPA: amino acid permease [Caulobacteraceae bacterium]|jgi:APA family basic amino acid/polyamine antiporter